MNYHYIDYMIKERQREELEVCERRRLLKSASHFQTGLSHERGTVFSKLFQRLKGLQAVSHKWLRASAGTIHTGVQSKGGRSNVA